MCSCLSWNFTIFDWSMYILTDRRCQVISAGDRERNTKEKETLTVVSRLDYCASDPSSIPAWAVFPAGIRFWVIT